MWPSSTQCPRNMAAPAHPDHLHRNQGHAGGAEVGQDHTRGIQPTEGRDGQAGGHGVAVGHVVTAEEAGNVSILHI